MITLAQAFKLLSIRNNDIVYLRLVDEPALCELFTGRKIRETYDMKAVEVHRIGLHKHYSDYPSCDWELEVKL